MKAIRHTGIVVADLKKALRFYRDMLGLRIIKDMTESGRYIDKMLSLKDVRVRTVKMAADDQSLIELLHFQSRHAKTAKRRTIYEAGISHIAFTVENLDSLYSMLKQRGIVFNASPQYSPDGYAKVTFCKDPEGNLIELVEVLTDNK